MTNSPGESPKLAGDVFGLLFGVGAFFGFFGGGLAVGLAPDAYGGFAALLLIVGTLVLGALSLVATSLEVLPMLKPHEVKFMGMSTTESTNERPLGTTLGNLGAALTILGGLGMVGGISQLIFFGLQKVGELHGGA